MNYLPAKVIKNRQNYWQNYWQNFAIFSYFIASKNQYLIFNILIIRLIQEHFNIIESSFSGSVLGTIQAT